MRNNGLYTYNSDWTQHFITNLGIIEPAKLSEWSEKHFVIADGAGAESGLFRCDRTPYIRGILDAVTDPQTRQIIVCAGIQVGKTTAELAALTYYMLHEPSPIILVEPSSKLVEDIGRDRIRPQIAQTPELKELFEGENLGTQFRNKETNITKSKLVFPAGFLQLASAQSKTDLISRACRIVLCDEIDQYAPRPDGKAVDLAIGRSTTFFDHKVMMVSSPSTLSTSEIWRRLHEDDVDQHEYRIPCPHCGYAFAWKWSDVSWIDDKPETASIHCRECGEQIRDGGACSDQLLSSGYWHCVHRGNGTKKGFHLTGLLSPWKQLREIASEFSRASKLRDYDSLRAFVQNRLAEPWDDLKHASKDVDSIRFFEDEESYDTSAVRVITVGIDVQQTRLECYWWGWSDMEESWLLKFEVVAGSPLADSTWQDLARLLREKITLSDGRQVLPRAYFIDSGGADGVTSRVYRFTKPLERHRVYAIKGRGGDMTDIISPIKRTNHERAPLIEIGTHTAKRICTERLHFEAGSGAGEVHLPSWAQGEIWEQLTSERLEQRIEGGAVKNTWVKTRERNEALDCFVYAYAAFVAFGRKQKSK